jgi:RNA polymerase primary sigma factor
MDAPMSDEHSELIKYLPDSIDTPYAILATEEEDRLWSKKLDALLQSRLNDRERNIVWMWAGGEGFKEIGESLGVTKQRVHQLQSKAMGKLITK